MERFLDYWQAAAQQIALSEMSPAKITDKYTVISRDELFAGKLSSLNLSSQLINSTVCVAPYYACPQQENAYFLPYILVADIDETGKFISKNIYSLPIVLKKYLEPAELSGVSLGFAENFDQYFVLQPPEWIEDPKLLTWSKQLHYAQKMLDSYIMQDSAIIFPLSCLCPEKKLDVSLLSKKSKIELVEAPLGADRHAYAQRLIVSAWMEAAVKQADAPNYFWLRANSPVKYASIFDCAQSYNSRKLSKLEIHVELSQIFNLYIKGQQLLRSWQTIVDNLRDKYSERGGIEVRLNQLREQLKTSHAHNRHMQVLYSIWLRQLEMVSAWSSFLDIIPGVQKRRLNRLYVFLQQNFPSEETLGLNYNQLIDFMLEKLRRAESRERFVADALHQIESDIRQEQLVFDKWMHWSRDHNITLHDLNITLWDKLVNLTADYWSETQIDPTCNEIEKLIVEHAEYVSPMQAAELLAVSKSAVIIGNYNPICNPRFAVQIDYELTKHFKLTSCDADFEDLQFDGVLGSLGNLWSLAAQGREANKTLPVVANKINYSLINVGSVSEDYFGSKINKLEVIAILDWLKLNYAANADVVIYTVFSGQLSYMRKIFANTEFSKIKLLPLQEPSFISSSIALLSTVYSVQDQGPYVFDRGVEILDNLIASARSQIIVFGDERIFKPELHSATGKFAKLLYNKQEQEVANV